MGHHTVINWPQIKTPCMKVRKLWLSTAINNIFDNGFFLVSVTDLKSILDELNMLCKEAMLFLNLSFSDFEFFGN